MLVNKIFGGGSTSGSGGGSSSGSSSALLELVGGTSEVNLTKEDLGDITTINACAFYGKENLKSIELSDKIKKIGKQAFMNSGLTGTVVVPYVLAGTYGSNSLGESAYEGCTGITKLIINAESIGGNINEMRFFYGCTSLAEVEFGETCTTRSIGWNAFAKCTALTTITIPSTVLYLLQNCFEGCTSLETVNLSDGLESISPKAFYACSKLKNITLPDTLQSIGSNAFRSCGALTSLNIPDSVTSIGDYAFQYCSSLTAVNFGSGLSAISQYSFQGCSSLTSITIPSNITSIGTYAFSSCTGLTTVNLYQDFNINLNNSGFQQCSNLTHDTLVDMISKLADRTGQSTKYYFHVGSTNLAKLSDEEKLVITNKGWTAK